MKADTKTTIIVYVQKPEKIWLLKSAFLLRVCQLEDGLHLQLFGMQISFVRNTVKSTAT